MSGAMGYPSGVCRFCGGTDDEPSKLTDGSEAGWMDADRNTCMAPACQARLAMEPKIKRRIQRNDLADLMRRKAKAVEPIARQIQQRKEALRLRHQRGKGSDAEDHDGPEVRAVG